MKGATTLVLAVLLASGACDAPPHESGPEARDVELSQRRISQNIDVPYPCVVGRLPYDGEVLVVRQWPYMTTSECYVIDPHNQSPGLRTWYVDLYDWAWGDNTSWNDTVAGITFRCYSDKPCSAILSRHGSIGGWGEIRTYECPAGNRCDVGLAHFPEASSIEFRSE
jgi:hypothetical protein